MRTGPPISTSLFFCRYIREAYFNIFQVDPVISMIIPLASRHFGSDLAILIEQQQEAKRGGCEASKGRLRTHFTPYIDSAKCLKYLQS